MKQALTGTIKLMLSPGKGILAADESDRTATKRLEAEGIESTAENRRRWRQVLLTAPRAEQYLGGVILYDETIRQSDDTGTPFADVLQAKGIVPGIKVDQGTEDLPGNPGETITKGLEGLAERLAEYYQLGARFAKWRAVIKIADGLPSPAAIKANTQVLAEYAGLCQAAGIVPMVEPEVLYDGTHTIERSAEVLQMTLSALFTELAKSQVDSTGTILKTSMALPGKDSDTEVPAAEVAKHTAEVLKKAVPDNLGGVVFLSGGQAPLQATQNLNEIARLGPFMWPVSFSYSRAVQEPVLSAWRGSDENSQEAQGIFLHRLKMNSLASQGQYYPDFESQNQ